MMNLTPIEGRPLANPDELPQRSAEERLEDLARELMTVTAMLRSAELRDQLCPLETINRAKQALQTVREGQRTLRAACEPASLTELSERISDLIKSIPYGDPADGYKAALTVDVGSLQPSWGALEVACRKLRTTAMHRPKIPEVLAAVREAGALYEAALRALDELPGQIARAEHAQEQAGRRSAERSRMSGS